MIVLEKNSLYKILIILLSLMYYEDIFKHCKSFLEIDLFKNVKYKYYTINLTLQYLLKGHRHTIRLLG